MVVPQSVTRRQDVCDATPSDTDSKAEASPSSSGHWSKVHAELPWHSVVTDDVVDRLQTNPLTGLTREEAASRLRVVGPNELEERERRTAAAIFVEQLRGPMIMLLVGAAIVSAFLGEFVDVVAILAIVLLNALLGLLQDYRAERAIAELKRFAVPNVKVRRDGQVHEVSAAELVPGDVMVLETGCIIPADGRLLDVSNLKVQESALTGESESVVKQLDEFPDANLQIADRLNMVYLGTTVTYGHGIAVVTATGMKTELGKIADSLQTVRKAPTPLQRRLDRLGRTLAFIAMGIVLLVFVIGLLTGETPKLMLMTALSLAVAIVPEGLPAVATVALALGARRMAERRAVIRRLPAVETLGSVTVICSDKTGTLTENRMSVEVLDVAGLRQTDVHHPDDEASQPSGISLLLTAGALCNDAELVFDEPEQRPRAIGDPTETAILVAAAELGFRKSELEIAFPRVAEAPFDSDRKCMTTVHAQRLSPPGTGEWQQRLVAVLPLDAEEHLVCTKGAVDAVLERSAYVWDGEAPVPIDASWRERIATAQSELAQQGMRVLGIAFRLVDELPDDIRESEQELIFIGLMAMIDPPRQEARDAVRRCREAGIRPIMITGDHQQTAVSIACDLGIVNDATDTTSTGLTEHAPDKVEESHASVYARVSPHDKLQIVKSLQEQGEVVAMTGDGVNDAPALKQADIGVAMGRIGTDVAKEASDMVLLDDNFATIVNAVEEGRVVFDNIRKFVKYTMTSNAGELFVMLIGPLLGMPLPLLPLQILWINLVTDGLPGLALAVEPAEPGTMHRPPYPPDQRIFDRGMIRDILWIGTLMAGVSLCLGYLEWVSGTAETAHWRTIVFTVLTIAQMGNALASRSQRHSLFRIGLFTNRAMLLAVLLTLTLQLLVIYLPPLQTVFRTVPLSSSDLGLCFAMGAVVMMAIEVKKALSSREETT